MQECYVDSFSHPLYKPFHDLYSVSFPIFEQRTAQQQADAFQKGHYYKLLAFIEMRILRKPISSQVPGIPP